MLSATQGISCWWNYKKSQLNSFRSCSFQNIHICMTNLSSKIFLYVAQVLTSAEETDGDPLKFTGSRRSERGIGARPCCICFVFLGSFIIPPPPMPPHVLVDFVVFPPGHGRSVTDFWGWDAHEARLPCPDDVSGDIGWCSARRALKPKFYWPTQTMVTAGILPFRENSYGRTGNRTRDLMISRQRLLPLDHEAGQFHLLIVQNTTFRLSPSHSATESQPLRFSVEFLTCPVLLEGPNFFFFAGIYTRLRWLLL